MPERQTEAYYNANAKAGCHECAGKGMVRDFHSQDNSSIEPCSTCFPNDPAVIRLRESKAEYEALNRRSGIVAVRIPG
jgi:hypothetical protein